MGSMSSCTAANASAMLKRKLATGIPVEHVDLWDRHGIDAAEHLYALIRNHS